MEPAETVQHALILCLGGPAIGVVVGAVASYVRCSPFTVWPHPQTEKGSLVLSFAPNATPEHPNNQT